MVLYINKNKVEEVSFAYEKDFEEFIVENQKLLFGSKSIYLNLKKKLRSETLGNSIPDGFLFDFEQVLYISPNCSINRYSSKC